MNADAEKFRRECRQQAKDCLSPLEGMAAAGSRLDRTGGGTRSRALNSVSLIVPRNVFNAPAMLRLWQAKLVAWAMVKCTILPEAPLGETQP